MLRFVDGADVAEHEQEKLKYNAYSASLDQTLMVTPGRDGFGRAFCIVNNGFGESNYLVAFDAQATWGFHMDMQVSRLGTSGGFGPTIDWFVIQRPDGLAWANVLTLRLLSTGQLQIVGAGGPDTVAVAPLVIDTYATIELKAAVGGQVVLKVNGSVAAHGTLAMPATLPSRLGFRWQTFGPPSLIIDNFVIWDGQAGDTFDDFTGRIRVTTLLPVSDVLTAWTPSSGATCYAMVNDDTGRPNGSPDGDFTYVARAAGDQLFTLQPGDCYGRVLAVAFNVCGRVTAGAGAVAPVAQLAGSTVSVLGALTLGTSYATQQAIATLNPETDDTWTDAEINNGWWGVRSAAPAARVTANYLEKVVDLTGLPFTCGGASSYSFQR